MRVGVFTPLLSQFPLDAVLKKVADLNIKTVELGTEFCRGSTLQAGDAGERISAARFQETPGRLRFQHQRVKLSR